MPLLLCSKCVCGLKSQYLRVVFFVFKHKVFRESTNQWFGLRTTFLQVLEALGREETQKRVTNTVKPAKYRTVSFPGRKSTGETVFGVSFEGRKLCKIHWVHVEVTSEQTNSSVYRDFHRNPMTPKRVLKTVNMSNSRDPDIALLLGAIPVSFQGKSEATNCLGSGFQIPSGGKHPQGESNTIHTNIAET